MKRLSLALLFATACGHTRPAPVGPAPWAPETPPPPPRAVEPAPSPSTPPPSSTSRVPKDAEIPGEGTAHAVAPPRPERARLSSGAEVLLVRRPRLPLVTLQVVWPTGAADEPTAQAGLAWLTADLLSEGAGSRSALELAAEVERLGARLSTQAGWDSTVVSMTVLTRVLDPALQVLGDVVLRPKFPQTEIDRVRKSTKASLMSLLDQPSFQAGLVGARALYGQDHRYGELVQGNAHALDALTRDQIVAWHAAHLRPSQATIVAVGDVDMRTLRPRLEKLFAGARPKGPAVARSAPKAPSKIAPRILFIDKPGAAQTEIRAFQPGPPRTTPDYFPLLVLNTIFGGNFSSRLNAKLREEKGYTYGARSDLAFRRDGGPFAAGAPVKTAVTRAALADLRTELSRLTKGEVNDVELALAKATLQRSLARMFETPPEVAAALATLKVYGLPDDYFTSYAQKIAAVTPADLSRVAATLKAEDMTLVFVGDEKVIGEEIKKELGPYEKLSRP